MTRIPCGLILVCSLHAQGFDVASIKPVTHPVGPDYNNQVTLRPASFSAHNVTLKRLIVEAYGIQAPQLSGPKWLAQNEYDIEAKFEPARRTRLPAMLQQLLTERFHLATHRDTKEMPVWELLLAPGGPHLQKAETDEPAGPLGSSHFRCTLPQFAELISVQLSMLPGPDSDPGRPQMAGAPLPVLDRTALEGVYDFHLDMRPETDVLAMWRRILAGMGLKLESRRTRLEMLVVDRADQIPTSN